VKVSKAIYILICILAWLIFVGSFWDHTYAEKFLSREVQITVSEVFVPETKKSSGESYVIVSGMFPNSCYTWKGAEVTHKTPKEHEIKVFANVVQMICLMVLVPFSHEVVIGKLESGHHVLRFLNGDGTYFEKNLVIE
jgi:hypothetical protein